MRYLIEFGRDPTLSKVELTTCLENKRIQYKVIAEGKQVIIIDCNSLPSSLIDELGGTIRIGKVIADAPRLDELEHALNQQELYNGTANKIEFYTTNYQSQHASFFIDWLKDYFKEIRVKALQKKDPTPSKLHKKTDVLDFILYRTFIAKTIAITNPNELKQRDLGRPAVDYMKVISIRLAKILVNLAGLKANEVLLDPFCGSGTILQEALLKGYNVIGCDQDPVAIDQTKQNLTWIEKAYPFKTHWRAYQANAIKIHTILPRDSIDGVVTEPYLGPYLRRKPTLLEAKRTITELTDLYKQLFQELERVLKKGKRIVIILPQFQTLEGRTVRVHLPELIAGMPFQTQHTIQYQPPKSKIGREVIVLQKY